MPYRSISARTAWVGSMSAGMSSGMSLNMYSTGISKSSLDCLSCSWGWRNLYQSFLEPCGMLIMVSITPTSGSVMASH